MMSKSRIRNIHKSNQKVKFGDSDDFIQLPNYQHPVFCFKYLSPDYNIDSCEINDKKELIEKIVQLSQMTWNQIKTSPKNGLGSEKISVKSIKPGIPSFITEDVEFLLALRYYGKKAVIGHRNKFIFHVIFIDRDFTVYDHGS